MKTAIISPSGKFYGSEQTLYNFLTLTEGYSVYIKQEENGLFSKLESQNYKHFYHTYNSVVLFYLLFSFKLLFRYNKVYVNEAGHSKYVILLSKIFVWKSFYIHVRLTEDTCASRWKGIGNNVNLISTSQYIADLLYTQIKVQSEVISSPARAFRKDICWNTNITNQKNKKLGVIGRLTSSKGIHKMIEFIGFLETKKLNNFSFYFFGDVDHKDQNVVRFLELCKDYKYVEVNFEGFVEDKMKMFDSVDLIVHFNKEEPLGVIFLEALNQGKPIIGFNSGGIGCIADNLLLQSQMVDESDGWCEDFLKAIENIDIEKFKEGRKQMLVLYSPEEYCKRIEELIS